MRRLRWSLPIIVLLAACGLAAAQTAPASTPAAPLAQSSVVHPADVPGKDEAPAVAAASLPPQQERLLDEADQLLDLAQKLKAEVDKTNQYTLSLNTLRRANDIEKLAKNLEKQIQHDNH